MIMADVTMQIDGREVGAKEGMTILEAAREAGVQIPTLCHHEKLEPFGGCRLCIVEVDVPYAPRTGRSKVTGTVAGTIRTVRDMRAALDALS